jgi:hypothetical protein
MDFLSTILTLHGCGILTLKLCRGEILLPQVPFWNSKKKKKFFLPGSLGTFPDWKLLISTLTLMFILTGDVCYKTIFLNGDDLHRVKNYNQNTEGCAKTFPKVDVNYYFLSSMVLEPVMS